MSAVAWLVAFPPILMLACLAMPGLAALVSRQHVTSLVFGFSILPALYWTFHAATVAVRLFENPAVIEKTTRILPPIAMLVVAVLAVALTAISAVAVIRRKPLRWPIVALYAIAFVHVLHMYALIEVLRDH
jgi:hypothetical protein